MTREEAITNLNMISVAFVEPVTMEQRKLIDDTFEMAIKALEQEPTSEMVHVETLRQVMWERDIAIEQLHELGYEWGQKIEPCDDEHIKVPKKALKYRTAGMVAYNVEWLKKNWQMEMDIVCGVKPCDDVASRILKRMWNCRGKHTTSIDKVKMEQIIRDELPSVTQKSGKWILLDECTNSGYYCSNCQKKLVKEGWSNTVKKIKFCPNCGARMESEDKE